MSAEARPLGVIVTSIGRREGLESLIDSLVNEPVVISIALQGGDSSLRQDLIERCSTRGIEHCIRPSGGGASRGRNDAVGWIRDRVDVLAFPNDTTIFPPRTVERILEATSRPGFSAGAVTVTDPTGPKFVLPSAGTALTPRNVWHVILPGMLMRTESFSRLGGFDETLGTGAPTPWQSGEETAILLRHRAEISSEFAWLSDIEVQNPHDTSGLDPTRRRRKLRGYARGYGRVLRLYGYGLKGLVRGLIAGVTFGFRHGSTYSAADGIQVALGRFEGFLGVLMGVEARTALREAPAPSIP